MSVLESEYKGGCTVVVDGPDENWLYTYCAKKVYGYRGEWKMCRSHYEMFAPDGWNDVGGLRRGEPAVRIALVVGWTLMLLVLAIIIILITFGWDATPASSVGRLR